MEAVPDFVEMRNVQLKNDNAQYFDGRWVEVPSTVTERPVDNMLGSVHRLQFGNSEELICLMQVYTQERFEKESHTVMTSWNKWHQGLWSKTIKESHFQGQKQTGRETHPWCFNKGKTKGKGKGQGKKPGCHRR